MSVDESARPITIPAKLTHDRAIRRLLTAWLHAHARYRVCTKRMNWRNAVSKRIEKARRKEKWLCVARILHIEHTLLSWLATSTHHPDLWTKPTSDEHPRRIALRKTYYQLRGRERHDTGKARTATKAHRASIVAQIRMLDRTWILTLLTAVDPTAIPPSPLPLHPRELLPRKVARASTILTAEVKS